MTEGARRRDAKPADIGAGFVQVKKPPEKLSDFIKANRGLSWKNFYDYVLRGVESLECDRDQWRQRAETVEASVRLIGERLDEAHVDLQGIAVAVKDVVSEKKDAESCLAGVHKLPDEWRGTDDTKFRDKRDVLIYCANWLEYALWLPSCAKREKVVPVDVPLIPKDTFGDSCNIDEKKEDT